MTTVGRASGCVATIGAIAALAFGSARAQTPAMSSSTAALSARVPALASALVSASSLIWTSVEQQPRDKDPDVPPAYRPPPGMCRVWLAGVPPAQQPAPTDCASAVRNRPSNGRVLFGDDYVKKSGRIERSPSSSSRYASGAQSAWRVRPALNIIDGSAATDTFAADSIPAPFTGTASTPAARGAGQDDYEAGYAAGYRDAMNGRRPRFRGVDRADPGTGGSYTGGYGAAAGGYPRGGAPYGGSAGGGSPFGGTSGGTLGGSTSGRVLVVPPGEDPRYFNNGRYAPPGRANGVCLDRDGDGWCDDPRFGAPVCRDLDGDGRCDDYPDLAAAPYPSSLPEMRAGVDVKQGRGSAAALRWLGTSEVVARVVDPKRNGTPYRVLWFDANTNTLLQTWTDLDGDGVADRIEIFRNGRRVKLLGR